MGRPGGEGAFAGSEPELAALAAALAGPDARPTAAERALRAGAAPPDPDLLDRTRRAIAGGGDPLGEAFLRLRSPEVRRESGAIYTPRPLVDATIAWAAAQGAPARVVDPGAGSGRFVLAAAAAFPRAALLAVETDPLAALALRANAAARGVADRLTVLVEDYRGIDPPPVEGATLFVGNPPYVRHHGISPRWKAWFAEIAAASGIAASKLAGLHIHFFFKTRALARPGDYGAFVTSSEWLDTGYGDAARKLLADGLGGTAVHRIAPGAMPFAGTATTGAIACFRVGRAGRGMRFRAVETLSELGSLGAGRPVARPRLAGARRWSPFLRPRTRPPRGHVELGELCRVHRGQVTGRNAVWIAGPRTGPLPDSVLAPAVTRARELIEAAPVLRRDRDLRRVVDLPADLDEFDGEERRRVERFLAWARTMGADSSYVARHRRAWWAVGLRAPAPILCTYMARRPPAFVRNRCGARHLNIAHGLYPREPLTEAALDALRDWLDGNVGLSAGRVYAGGLVKFEPGELERVPIPPLEELHERTPKVDAGRTGEGRREGEGAFSPPPPR